MPLFVSCLRLVRRFAVIGLLLLAAGSSAQTPPFAIGGDPRVDPGDFEITVFASDLDAPLPMQELSDGSLLVGTNSGLRRLVDADDDGVADGPGTLLYTGGSGLVTGLRSVGDLLFMARGQTISVLRSGALPGDLLTLEASFVIELIYPWSHVSHTLAVREIALGVVELYFNMGSRADAVATTDLIPVSGAVTGVLIPDSIYRVVVDDTGPSVSLTGLERIATGVRNAFGIDFHPTTGDLYFEDNSMDGDTDPFELSVDELNVIGFADVGGSVEDFGFPDNYFAYRTDVEVGSGGIDPIVTFQPIPPPDGSESEGPVEIAFAPPDFPPGLREGLFVGFHGAFSVAGTANTDNPLVYVDLDTGDYFHFIENTEPGVGHPDGLLATDDALYVSDLSTTDGVVTNTGRIYKIRSLVLPEPVPALTTPSLWILSVFLIGVGVSARRRSGRSAV
jgi:glucose/arabinose dehydrogenase